MLLRLTALLFTAFTVHNSFAQCATLVWADEFEGNSLNLDNWSYQIGDGCDINLCGWGNNELQSYQQANASISNGELSITARSERVGSSNYTSARIRSIDKVDFTYGRIEARIKLPSGGGLWPAFWMLSTDEPYGFWPQSGEIDVMEWVGNQKAKIYGTLHYGQPSPNNSQTGATITSIDGDYGNEYHVYAVEWEPNVIRWYIDDFLFSTKTRGDVIPERWPFDHDFHLLLNMAVGGNFGGAVTPGIFPATMKVDYVRLYDKSRPRIVGDRFLSSTDRIGRYSITNIESPATVNWSAPAGVTILSGQGTPSVEVQWINGGGILTGELVNACGNQTLRIEIAPGVFRSSSLENFDDEGIATLGFTSGVLTEVQNPTPNAVNNSSIVGEYARNAESTFDVLVYELVNVLGDANAYATRNKQLYIDVLTDAPIGTEVLIQLETSAARSADYPIGRHSRYQAFTTKRGEWHRLALQFIDRPDDNANPRAIVQAPILFAPGTNTSNTFYYDNLDIYEAAIPSTTSNIADYTVGLSVSPNPAEEIAIAKISLETPAPLQLTLTNSIGQIITSIDLGLRSVGKHEVQLETGSLLPGTYTLTLQAEGKNVRSIALLKS